MKNENSKNRVALGIGKEDGAGLALYGENDKNRATLRIEGNNDNPALRMHDKNEKLIWSAPPIWTVSK